MRPLAWVLVVAGFATAVAGFWIAASHPLSNPWLLFVVGLALAVLGIVLLMRRR